MKLNLLKIDDGNYINCDKVIIFHIDAYKSEGVWTLHATLDNGDIIRICTRNSREEIARYLEVIR